MDISAKNQELISVFGNILVLGIFEDDKTLNDQQKKVDEALNGLISDYLIKKEGFGAKFGETTTLPTFLKMPADKIMIVGLGKKKALTVTKLRELSAKLIKDLEKTHNSKNVACELLGLNSGNYDVYDCARAIAEGVLIGSYEWEKYKTKKNKNKIKKFRIITLEPKDEKIAKNALNTAKTICSAMDFTKDLINESAQVATPQAIADMAKDICEDLGLEFKSFGKKELEEMNFNAFLAVGQGSEREPKLIHITYKPQNAKKKIVLIGKGITFDSGGLDIKPASSMLTMKTDMSGCATVLGVIQAVAALKPDVEVHVISALCENMPSGIAYKPGDVLVSKSGKTIEVDNTDAEGRITLADALTYADEIEADEIIDIATLTGACVVALGQNISGIMGNNQQMINKIIEKSLYCGENLWNLPLYDDMQDALKSDIADMRNTGSRFGGASIAARFLQNFTNNKNWAHIDIAGTAYIDKPYRELNKGATGVMVRTLTNYILSL